MSQKKSLLKLVILGAILAWSRISVSAQEATSSPQRVIPLGGMDFKLGGFVQAWYQSKEHAPSDFLIKNLRISMIGEPSPLTSFHVMPVFASGSGVSLLNAFVEVKPVDHLSFRMGQFVYPFGQNRMYGPQQLELANYQLNGKVFPGIVSDLAWDIGAQTAVTYPHVDARIAVVNGTGPNVVKDTDTIKDLAARVELYPLGNKQVIAGVSYYNGTSHGNATVKPLFPDPRTWWGGHAKLVLLDKKAVLHGEVISRSDSNRLWVTQGSYKFKYWKEWQLVAALERFDPNSGHHARRVTGGVNFWLDAKTRLTMNVFNDDDGKTNVNNFVTQLQVEF